MDKTLLLFSGGRDSILTACRIAESGRHCLLVHFDNGSIAGMNGLGESANRLRSLYGPDKISFAGTYPIIAAIRILDADYQTMAPKDAAGLYPDLLPPQAMCLHCQTAMYAAAIACASAWNIKAIAAGNRKDDPFCTGLRAWRDMICEAASAHGIEIVYPVLEPSGLDPDPDKARGLELMARGFLPKVMEPKCLAGRPVPAMTHEQETSIAAYARDHVMPKLNLAIKTMGPMFKTRSSGGPHGMI